MKKIAVGATCICKTYSKHQVVTDVSFDVGETELFGFIGPDGAGKTTLFRILCTLLIADSGTVSVFGQDVIKDYHKIRQITGYMPGRFSLYQDLTVEENLKFWASVFGATVDENYDLIRSIYSHIEPFARRPVHQLSGGMKQKLALSCALVHGPRLLVLDEPTTGVDAVSRSEYWDMLKHLVKRGITILVSTPYMDEAGQCDRVALMQNGKILTINPPDSIVKDYTESLWAVSSDQKYLLLKNLRSFPGIASANVFGDSVHITMKDNTLDENQLRRYLGSLKSVRIQRIEPTIEDRFLQLMQEHR